MVDTDSSGPFMKKHRSFALTTLAMLSVITLADCHRRPRLSALPEGKRFSIWRDYVNHVVAISETRGTSAAGMADRYMGYFVERLRKICRFSDQDLRDLLLEADAGHWGDRKECDVPVGPIKVAGWLSAPLPYEPIRAVYMPRALKHGTEGVVILQLVIQKSGETSDFRVVKGLPDGLTESALASAREGRWLPAMICGKPVAVQYTITVSFDLESRSASVH